jgi:hypothetical protein
MSKKLNGILIEVNGGVVSYVQFNGKPLTAYHLFDWDELLGDSDTRRAWEGLSSEEHVPELCYVVRQGFCAAARPLHTGLAGISCHSTGPYQLDRASSLMAT